MSANNLLLVRLAKDGRWTFTDENADCVNSIPPEHGEYSTRDEAFVAAAQFLRNNIVEYGIHLELNNESK